MSKQYWVYILCSKKHGTLYIGVTGNLSKRIYEHKTKIRKGFTSKYGVDKLVYSEEYGDIGYALDREKQLKKWERKWKIELIESANPNWDDWYNTLH